MATEFIIQVGNPRTESTCDPEDASLSDAMQTVFPMATERMLMVWNGVYVPLGYKYDVSLMIDDIINLCNDVLAVAEGHRPVWWPSNSFAAIWDITWRSTGVAIDAQWNRVVGGTEALLASRPSISIPQEDFLSEWKRPLEIIADALRRAGYTSEQIPKLPDLHAVTAKIPRYGQLYRSSIPQMG